MSIFDKRKLIDEYTDEIRKQTDPYGYFCRNEDIQRGELRNGSCPPFRIITDLRSLIFGTGEEDEDAEVSAEETSKKYLFIRTEGVGYESDELSRYLMSDEPVDIMYWDEDRISQDKRHAPFFKPDWSYDTLLNCNYIGDSYIVGTGLAMRVIDLIRNEWCDRELNDIENNVIMGEEDMERRSESEVRYDFLLRASELAQKIIHVPVVATHIPDETADDTEIYSEYTWQNQSQKYIKIRNDALKRRGLPIIYEKVFERKDNSVINNNAINNIVIKSDHMPMKLSVIIPSKDHSEVLAACMDSIRKCYIPSPEKQLEIIIVDNGSGSAEGIKIEDYLRGYTRDIKVKYIYREMDFNYSVMCDIGAKESTGDCLLFLNDDIELIDDSTLERMYAYASLPHAGAVGAKLYYPGGNIIQHTGVAVDLDCGPTHKLATYPDDKPYYYGRNVFNMNVLALTGACLMVNREKYFNCGGFDDRMGVGYNDIDLCVRLYENGFWNVLLNECILFHHESLSRGMDHMDDLKYKRLREERQLLYDKHPWIREKGDPFYSPNLIPDTLDYSVNVMAEHTVRSSRNKSVDDAGLENKLYRLLKKNTADKEAGKVKIRKGSAKLHFNIERTGFFRGIMNDEEDYFMIEGWSTLTKRDNALYSTELAFIDHDGECLVFDTFKVSREDVSVVFVNERNLFLTGFVCKIPASRLKRDEVYRVAVIKRSGLTGIKYVSLGDYYEPARGYRTEEV
ncbi:MAG: glycosyltransferase [Lachnospiraceae bacterium]|nr:glycosyltransferase [Lachnospiraceae bacterium]